MPADLTSAKLAGRVVTRDGQTVLEQGCVFYRKQLCSIYHNSRPHVCASYQCDLFKRYASGDISKEDTLLEIRNTVGMVNSVKKKMRAQAGASAKNLSLLFTTWIASQGGCYSAQPEDHGTVWQEYQDLLLHLKRTFGFGKSNEATSVPSRLPDK